MEVGIVRSECIGKSIGRRIQIRIRIGILGDFTELGIEIENKIRIDGKNILCPFQRWHILRECNLKSARIGLPRKAGIEALGPNEGIGWNALTNDFGTDGYCFGALGFHDNDIGTRLRIVIGNQFPDHGI